LRDVWEIEECCSKSGDGALWISLQDRAWDYLPPFPCFIISNLIQTLQIPPPAGACLWFLNVMVIVPEEMLISVEVFILKVPSKVYLIENILPYSKVLLFFSIAL
jgi:hypothetical protein